MNTKSKINIVLIILLTTVLILGYTNVKSFLSVRSEVKKYNSIIKDYEDLSKTFEEFKTLKEAELGKLDHNYKTLKENFNYNKGVLNQLKNTNSNTIEKARELENILEGIRKAIDLNKKNKITNEELDIYFINLFGGL